MEIRDKCPIWGTPAFRESFESAAGAAGPYWVSGFDVDSDRAGGSYAIEKPACDELQHPEFDAKAKARLTTWLMDQRRLGVDRPRITRAVAEDARRRRSLPLPKRADRLLASIERDGDFAGDTVPVDLDTNVDVFVWSESVQREEIEFLLNYLFQRGLIEKVDVGDGNSEVTVTVEGYARLSDLEATAVESKQAFVAMWFDASMIDAYESGIAPALVDSGYQPVRIDRKDHNNKIDDEIIAEIRRSRFLVADFTEGSTGARGGVYYEAGFAHGMSIPVIFTCRADAVDRVHFDTRQYNHITWTTPGELRKRLAQRVSATVGDGPLKDSRNS